MAPSSNKGQKTSSGSSSHRSGFIPTPSSSSFSDFKFNVSTASTNNNSLPSGASTGSGSDARVSFQLSTYLNQTATEDGPTYGRLLHQAQNPNIYYNGAPHVFDADLHNDSKK